MEQEIKMEKSKLLDLQMITIIILIGALFLSMVLTYNQKKIVWEDKGLFEKHQSRFLMLFNKFVVVGLTIVFLYISQKNKDISQAEGKHISAADTQLLVAQIAAIAAILALFVILTGPKNNNDDEGPDDIAEVLNPEI